MPANFACEIRSDLRKQVGTLCQRFDNLYYGRRIDLSHESVSDRWCRLTECRAIVDHTKGIQKQLALHLREHGCETHEHASEHDFGRSVTTASARLEALMLMQRDPMDGILAAARVLDVLYSKNFLNLHPLVQTLRTFAETEEERDMLPDDLARTVIARARARLRYNSQDRHCERP